MHIKWCRLRRRRWRFRVSNQMPASGWTIKIEYRSQSNLTRLQTVTMMMTMNPMNFKLILISSVLLPLAAVECFGPTNRLVCNWVNEQQQSAVNWRKPAAFRMKHVKNYVYLAAIEIIATGQMLRAVFWCYTCISFISIRTVDMLQQEATIYLSTLNNSYFPSTWSKKNPKYLSISSFSVLAFHCLCEMATSLTVCLRSQMMKLAEFVGNIQFIWLIRL